MNKVTQKERSKLARKFLQFEKKGLESYRKYLEKEQNTASKSDNKKHYLKYIQKELAGNYTRLQKLNEKLG